MGLSLREIVAVLDWLGVDRSHGAVLSRIGTLERWVRTYWTLYYTVPCISKSKMNTKNLLPPHNMRFV
jgi:hypothetical protein